MSQNFSKPHFTEGELASFDGKDGSPCYFAYKGKVYDVTDSFLWKKGNHQVLHEAGRDLTGDLKDAPHGEEFIERCPVVGFLQDQENKEE